MSSSGPALWEHDAAALDGSPLTPKVKTNGGEEEIKRERGDMKEERREE